MRLSGLLQHLAVGSNFPNTNNQRSTMGIVPRHDPDKQRQQEEMDQKARLLIERSKRKTPNGRLTPEATAEAAHAAGIKPITYNQTGAVTNARILEAPKP